MEITKFTQSTNENLFPDIKNWDKMTGNHAFVAPVEKEPDEEPNLVIYCVLCGTSISSI